KEKMENEKKEREGLVRDERGKRSFLISLRTRISIPQLKIGPLTDPRSSIHPSSSHSSEPSIDR
ncbi:hypothetical protein PENTCL1PPCAC_11213, partial [Pristionchus entomophagus]